MFLVSYTAVLIKNEVIFIKNKVICYKTISMMYNIILRNLYRSLYNYRNSFSYYRTTHPERKHSSRRSQQSILEIITPLPLCCVALKSNECAVKFRLFSLKGNRTYIGKRKTQSYLFKMQVAAGGCSEKLKCLQGLGTRNSHKVIITRPYPGGGVLENSEVSLWD